MKYNYNKSVMENVLDLFKYCSDTNMTGRINSSNISYNKEITDNNINENKNEDENALCELEEMIIALEARVKALEEK